MDREELIDLEKDLRALANKIRSYRVERFRPDGITRCVEKGCSRWSSKHHDKCFEHRPHTCDLCNEIYTLGGTHGYERKECQKGRCPACQDLYVTRGDIALLKSMEIEKRKAIIEQLREGGLKIALGSVYLLRDIIG